MSLQELFWSFRRRWYGVVLVVAVCLGLSWQGIGAVEQTPIASAQVRVASDLNFFGSNVLLERQAVKALETLNAESIRNQAFAQIVGEPDPNLIAGMTASRTTDSDVVIVQVPHPNPATASLIANQWVQQYVAAEAQELAELQENLAELIEEQDTTSMELTNVVESISQERSDLALQVDSARIVNAVSPVILSPELSADQSQLLNELQISRQRIGQLRVEVARIQVPEVIDLANEDGLGTTFPPLRFGLLQWLVVAMGASLALLFVGSPRLLSREQAQLLTNDTRALPDQNNHEERSDAVTAIAALLIQQYRKGTRVFAFKQGEGRPLELGNWLNQNGYDVEIVAATTSLTRAKQLTRPEFEQALRQPPADRSSTIILVDLSDVRSKDAGTPRNEEVLALVEISSGQTTDKEAARDLKRANRVADQTIALVA